MSKQGDFMIYCLEQYKTAKKLTGSETLELFVKYGICKYIYSCLEAFQTTRKNYIIEDIDNYIQKKQVE